MPAMRVRVTFGAICAKAAVDSRQRAEKRQRIRFMVFTGGGSRDRYLAAAGAFLASGVIAMNQPVVLWSALK